MEQRKEVGTKDSSLSTLHNTFLFIAFLLFPAFLPLPPFLFVGAYLLCVPSFFFVLSDSVYFPHFFRDFNPRISLVQFLMAEFLGEDRVEVFRF